MNPGTPLLALAAATALLQGQEVLTLDRAVALAVKNNRLVQAATLEVQKGEHQVAATRTYRLPQLHVNVFESQLLTRLDFTFPRGAFGTFAGIGPVPAANTSITTARRPNLFVYGTAAQPLSQLHRIGLGIRLQQLSRDLDREKLEAQQQAVAHNVKKVYYSLVQSQSALDATIEAAKLYTEIDRIVGEGLAQQVVLKSDSLDVKANLAKAEYTSVLLRNTMSSLREQLNQLMGRDLRAEFRVETLLEPTASVLDIEAARARALAQRPEIKEARLKIHQAEYDRRMKKAEYIPNVSLTFSYLSPFSISLVPKNIAAAGLMLDWDVFDWGRKKHEMAAKTLTLEQAKLALQETEAQLVLEVDTRHRKLQESQALLKVAQLTIESAREKVRVSSNRYSEKAALLKDVLQTQTGLADANSQYQQALAGYWTARAEFEKSLGER